MSLDSSRFVSDRSYAVGKAIYMGVIVLCLLATFLFVKIVTEVIAWADGDTTYPSNVISVTGEGEVVAVPDVAEFSFSVNERGPSVEDAQDIASGKMNAAIDFLKGRGIEEKDIETTGYNAYPQYEYSTCRDYVCVNEQRLVGYEVSQTISVTVRDTSKAGELLSGVGSVGVSNISGISFKVDDTEKFKAEARLIAIEKAKAQAETLAEGLGVKLKGVVSFNEESSPSPYYGYDAMGGAEMMAKSSVAPQLPAGEEKVTSRVYVTYEIR
ncbi:MAG: SIMPL domain-containing protein [Candidatus Paceibacterota bacterium]